MRSWRLSIGVASIEKQSEVARGDASWDGYMAKPQGLHADDCSVPQGWAEDPWLANWVSKQRDPKKKLDGNNPNPYITTARAAKLDARGFNCQIGRLGAKRRVAAEGHGR